MPNARSHIEQDVPDSQPAAAGIQRLRCAARNSGLWSALVLAMAILALLDGLQAVVRGSAYQLNMLAGERESVSGPCPAVSPSPADVLVQMEPETAPLLFHFEAFFSSYWTGTGMWRGVIEAGEVEQNQRCMVRIGLRGIPAKPVEFEVCLWESAAARQAADPSFIYSMLGIRPFFAALGLAVVGLSIGLWSFSQNRRVQRSLRELGYHEIFRTKLVQGHEFRQMFGRGLHPTPQTRISEGSRPSPAGTESALLLWCLPFTPPPRVGEICRITDAEGRPLAEAIARQQGKAALELRLLGEARVTPGCMVSRMGSPVQDNSDASQS